jgi:threonine-phosphate decarboxylase
MDLHGGNIYKIFREKEIKEILDYSSNINPFGLPESLKKAIIENMDVLEKYPDPDYYDLRKIIARYNGVEIENVLAGNGATELIFLYMKAVKPKKALILSPTFAEYERGIKTAAPQCEITYFHLKETEDFQPDIKRLKEEMKNRYDLIVLCNPNNPTGKFLTKEKIKDILAECDKYNTKLFTDEAFVEFVEGGVKSSIAGEEINKKNLFIIRALTKFFAMPGLRLGYALFFDAGLKQEFDRLKEPWSVNAFAELAGKILFSDSEYIEKTEKWIKEEKKYMYKELGKISNIRVYETETNFILIKMPGKNAADIREKMLENGILVRDASNFTYLDGTFIRLAVKDRENNNIVIKNLDKVINGDNENE